jgi:PadR family transcriptional regulator, regulatory protein PadR
MSEHKTDVPYGTLDLLILKTLDTMGPMHGYRIARRIEQVAENLLRLNQGSIYPALIRLEEQGWIRTQWGISETKRKVKFYSLTRAGAKQLSVEVAELGAGDGAGGKISGSWGGGHEASPIDSRLGVCGAVSQAASR